ncbi:hypothetical protein ACHAW5_006712 [Stephanodiscus triporus]|uniref:Coproporphyrinogen oxidase n=1 Tax=Stephanodiscus triporus TaxID=2934178 RepID=A0ABD3N2S3_9STRA
MATSRRTRRIICPPRALVVLLSLLASSSWPSPSPTAAEAFAPPSSPPPPYYSRGPPSSRRVSAPSSEATTTTTTAEDAGVIKGGASSSSSSSSSSFDSSPEAIFEEFALFLASHQSTMIDEIERADGSGEAFSSDGWGSFAEEEDGGDVVVVEGRRMGRSGGITRVIQGGDVVEKGACSLTIIRDGVLTADRAAAIRGRQRRETADGVDDEETIVVGEGDVYSAAALSVVLHTRNPFVPTFRSDVRIFLVRSSSSSSSTKEDGEEEADKVGKSRRSSVAWFGGGSDLTPYYLIDRDVIDFHTHLKETCDRHFPPPENNDDDDHRDDDLLSYRGMKRSCDEYFYLPARGEHRGTGGIFFDDVPASRSATDFVMDVARGWMPSWLPIVSRNRDREYTEEEKHWQCLRRGRYLEFNLLYDRGVRFGLANVNPRVEGVMVSAPPMIAYDYNHVPHPGGEEERLVGILKNPRNWV